MKAYLNTDLDLESAEDLTALANALEDGGVFPLHLGEREEGGWFARFETSEEHGEPVSNIAAMIAVVESLPPALRVAWSACTVREFNIGYQCGSVRSMVDHGLSAGLLARLSSVGAALRLTLYPD